MIVSKNFIQRTVVSTLSILILTIGILISHDPTTQWITLLGFLVLHTIALQEYVQLCRGNALAVKNLYFFSNLYLFTRYLSIKSPHFEHLQYIPLFLGAIGITTSFFAQQNNALKNMALSFFGFLLVSLPLSFLLEINFIPRLVDNSHTSFWFLWLLVVVKGSDMAAYVAGKLLGTHKLAATLSPKKTIEGAVAGILAAGILSIGLALLYRKCFLYAWPLDTYGFLGSAVGFVAIIGDLSESLIKRSVGVKDSSSIPGLGGVLDIADSLIFTAPMLYFYLHVSEVFL